MSDFRKTLSEMRRPSMLMRAARLGLPDYHRGRWLKRLAPGETSPERILPQLLTAEERLEATRRRGDACYSIAQHIEVLIALLAEASLLRREVV
ncbi:hypothetical protein G5B31_19875 [Rhodobacter sp. SGA-6-6]|uniref:DUF6477 family protein n=1 Tax=Rhodobacter sp. SGA-6-6 TaxID=2710882 RepID=UPI0013EC424B|nr:DUF6477 family protein [Rhodobacter sp. SGA-6-6]NGM47794.1 hypothetical protein [Rhodobacter sp. SGA-6-6]